MFLDHIYGHLQRRWRWTTSGTLLTNKNRAVCVNAQTHSIKRKSCLIQWNRSWSTAPDTYYPIYSDSAVKYFYVGDFDGQMNQSYLLRVASQIITKYNVLSFQLKSILIGYFCKVQHNSNRITLKLSSQSKIPQVNINFYTQRKSGRRVIKFSQYVKTVEFSLFIFRMLHSFVEFVGCVVVMKIIHQRYQKGAHELPLKLSFVCKMSLGSSVCSLSAALITWFEFL